MEINEFKTKLNKIADIVIVTSDWTINVYLRNYDWDRRYTNIDDYCVKLDPAKTTVIVDKHLDKLYGMPKDAVWYLIHLIAKLQATPVKERFNHKKYALPGIHHIDHSQSLTANRSSDTDGVYEMGSIMPQEHAYLPTNIFKV